MKIVLLFLSFILWLGGFSFAVGLHPYYLPRKMSHAILITIYIHPFGNLTAACDIIHGAVAELQLSHPCTLITMSGDFNHVNMDKTLTTFSQYVDCPTREGKSWMCCMLTLRTHTALSSSSMIWPQPGTPEPLLRAPGEKATCDH